MRQRPSAEWVRELAEAIYARHLDANDTQLEFMPDLADLAGVVHYVTCHPQLPGDIEDCLTIVWYLHGELDRLELSLLHAGRRHNLPWSQMAPAMGLRTPQAAEQRAIRLEAGLANPDPRTRREGDERAYKGGVPQEGRWLHKNRGRIRFTAFAVLAAMEGRQWWSDAAVGYEDDLREALDDPEASARDWLTSLGELARDWKWAENAPDLPALRDALALADEWDANR